MGYKNCTFLWLRSLVPLSWLLNSRPAPFRATPLADCWRRLLLVLLLLAEEHVDALVHSLHSHRDANTTSHNQQQPASQPFVHDSQWRPFALAPPRGIMTGQVYWIRKRKRRFFQSKHASEILCFCSFFTLSLNKM